jgi:primosomal protein N'
VKQRRARAPEGDAYVDIALPLPLLRSFTYRVEGAVPEPGTRVLVPFRRTERVGWVLGPGDPRGIKGVRSVLDVVEVEPSVGPDLLRLAAWIGEYYIAPVGIVLRSMLPSVLSDGSRELVQATEAGEAVSRSMDGPGTSKRAPGGEKGVAGAGISQRARVVLEAVAGHSSAVQIGPLRRRLDIGSIWPEVRALVEAGLLTRWTEPPRPPRSAPAGSWRSSIRSRTWRCGRRSSVERSGSGSASSRWRRREGAAPSRSSWRVRDSPDRSSPDWRKNNSSRCAMRRCCETPSQARSRLPRFR